MAQAHPRQILSLSSDSFAEALRELDPASRALLDLSLRRGMRPDEIAEILGADPETVAQSRDFALGLLAAELGQAPGESLDELRARLAELSPEDWTGVPRPANGSTHAATVTVIPVPDWAREDTEDEQAAPAAAPQVRRTRARPWLLLVALVAVAAVLAIVLATSGGGSSSSTPAAQPAKSTPAPAPAHAGAALLPVGPNGARAKGTASISNGRVHVDVTGLPAPGRGAYEVWLYNSVIDARPLGRSGAAHVVVNAKLPAGFRHYRFVDISLEPADGNPAHSGDSVVRVPVSKVR